jgi:7-carboxy-7-deazaguanine synthase
VNYAIAEKFKSVQGEGAFAGTPMAFIRFVGCSVGKKICHACDTDFEKIHDFRGGGSFTPNELFTWVGYDYQHICLTGGEPFDQDLRPLLAVLANEGWENMVHIETSGTVLIPDGLRVAAPPQLWICVSPKPGFHESVVQQADEIKVICPGLGSGDGWPTLSDARRWAAQGKIVYLQPRNSKHTVDLDNLATCQDIVMQHPELRLSVQLHKILKVR